MPRPRFSKLSPDKRRRIIETAALEFAAHGFEAASLNRIIDSAGISKGATYYYFDDKADLFAAVVLDGWNALVPVTDFHARLLERDTFWPVLLGLYTEMLKRAREQPWLTAVGRLVYSAPPSLNVSRRVAVQFARALDWLRALVERGQVIGAIRADLPANFLLAVLPAIIEAADRWMVEHREELGPERMDRMAFELFGMLRRFAEPPAAR